MADIEYDPATGEFVRKFKSGDRRIRGSISTGDGSCYYSLLYKGKTEYAHRLAWYLTTGVWPNKVDHRNGNGLDNRWDNLRLSTDSENALNISGPKASNTLGCLGVSLDQGKYKAQLKVNGVYVLRKRFDTMEEARDAYILARTQHAPEHSTRLEGVG